MNRNQTALLALVLAGLNFSGALVEFVLVRIGFGFGFGFGFGIGFGVGFRRCFYDRIVMAQTIGIGIVLVKRSGIACVIIIIIVGARNTGHAHGRRRIHAV